MGILSNMKPSKVWEYFEKICSIPHGSGNEEQISKYIENFAIERSLKYVRDSSNNVIIWAPGTLGAEANKPIILQGHMDMVAEQEPGLDIDMTREGLKLGIEGDTVFAHGTTLGGDDGIAVAYMLAILDDTTSPSPAIKHPPLECVITVDEERGMTGAFTLDMSLLSGRTMINLDSEDEGYLLVSCAGGVATTVSIPYTRSSIEYVKDLTPVKLKISGLTGGHSGCEIHKGRANADILMGRLLEELCDYDYNLALYSLNGGTKDNVIPNISEAIIAINNSDDLKDCITEMKELFLSEFGSTDPDIKIEVENISYDGEPIDYECRDKIIAALNTLPCGVQKMSPDIEDLPETSLSLGIMKTNDSEVVLTYLIRSNVDSSKEELRDKIRSMAEDFGAGFCASGDYPGWAYRKDSELRDIMFETFTELYGHEPVIQAIHAGVECGMFANSIPDFDAVSIGPDMQEIHTPNERLYIESTKRTWEYLLEVLSRL